jgi:hypothetical protein
MTTRTTKRLCLLRYTRCCGERVGIYLRGRKLYVEIEGERDRAPMTLPKWRNPDDAALSWAHEDALLCPCVQDEPPGVACPNQPYGWPKANGETR